MKKQEKRHLRVFLTMIVALCGLTAQALVAQNPVWRTSKDIALEAQWKSPLVVSDDGLYIFSADSSTAHPRIRAFELRNGHPVLSMAVDSLLHALGADTFTWKGHFEVRASRLILLAEMRSTGDSSYRLLRVSGDWRQPNYAIEEVRHWPLSQINNARCIGRTDDSCYLFRSAAIQSVQHSQGPVTYTEFIYTLSLKIYHSATAQWQTFQYQQSGETSYYASFLEDTYGCSTFSIVNSVLVVPPFAIARYQTDKAINLAENPTSFWSVRGGLDGCISRDSEWLLQSGRSTYIGPGSENMLPFERSAYSPTGTPSLLSTELHHVLVQQTAYPTTLILRYDYLTLRAIDTLNISLDAHSRFIVAAQDSLLLIQDSCSLRAYSLSFAAPPSYKLKPGITLSSQPCPQVTTRDTLRFSINVGATRPMLSYHWDFGDGTTSTERVPRHQYATSGMKTVSCKCTSSVDSTEFRSEWSWNVDNAFSISHKKTDTLSCNQYVDYYFYASAFARVWCASRVAIDLVLVHPDTMIRVRHNSSTVTQHLFLQHIGDYRVHLYEYADGVLLDSSMDYALIRCKETPNYPEALWTRWLPTPPHDLCLSKQDHIVLEGDSSKLFQSLSINSPVFLPMDLHIDSSLRILALARYDSGVQLWTYPRVNRIRCDAGGAVKSLLSFNSIFPSNEYSSGLSYWGPNSFPWTNSISFDARTRESGRGDLCLRRFSEMSDQNPHFPPPYRFSVSFAVLDSNTQSLTFRTADAGTDSRYASASNNYIALDSFVYYTVFRYSQQPLTAYTVIRMNINSGARDTVDQASSDALAYDERSHTILSSHGRYTHSAILSTHSLGVVRSIYAFGDQGYALVVIDSNGKSNGKSFQSLVRVVRLSDNAVAQQIECMSRVRFVRISFCSSHFIVVEENGRLSCYESPTEISRICAEQQVVQPQDGEELLTHPNPTHTVSNIDLTLKQSSDVRIRVYSTSGDIVLDNVYQSVPAGQRQFNIDLREQALGCYIIECTVGAENYVGRVVKIEE